MPTPTTIPRLQPSQCLALHNVGLLEPRKLLFGGGTHTLGKHQRMKFWQLTCYIRFCTCRCMIMEIKKKRTTDHILFFLDTGLSVCTIPALTHVSVSTISKLYSRHFSELLKTSDGHPKRVSPYDLGHSSHFGRSGGLIQLFKCI